MIQHMVTADATLGSEFLAPMLSVVTVITVGMPKQTIKQTNK